MQFMTLTIKKPSAWLPIALSLIVLAAWAISIAISGAPAPQPDEGVGAHLFQIWLGLEIFMIAFFAITWLPRTPKRTLLVLAIQIIAALAACAPVFFFHL